MKMLLKSGQVRWVLIIIQALFTIIILFILQTLYPRYKNKLISPAASISNHKLCIIVPFKERYEELYEFAPYMKAFLDKQAIHHEIWVINQMDGFRFNRASLINAGFLESSPSCDYIAMHDVDLVPNNPDILYSFPASGPFHVSSPGLHPRYSYRTFIGGILLITRKHFIQVNGLSNKYWGWGLEDDEFFIRLQQANLTIIRPKGIKTGRKGTFKHIHSEKQRNERDTRKCYNQTNVTRKRDRATGLNNIKYNIASKYRTEINSTKFMFVNVVLDCNRTITPWCNCSGAPANTGRVDKSWNRDVLKVFNYYG